MASKNFIVLGTPRSGTTFFCRTLKEQPDIWIPNFPNYEPFNPWSIVGASNTFKTHMFDQDEIVKRMIEFKKSKNIDYFGFKTFISFHSDIKGLIERNDLDIIVVLRKDFWKLMASQLIAIDHNDYEGSSTKYEPYFFENTAREERRIIGFFNEICKWFWWCENVFSKHKNFIDKIYLEELSKNGASFGNINSYFDRNIIFNSNYDDRKSLESYISNYDEFQKFIKEIVKKCPEHYKVLPDYVAEKLEL